MSLRHGLLGLLAEGPASGYDLARRFTEVLGSIWPAQHPKIYAELGKLAAEGLVEVESEGPRRRKAYRITDAGVAEVKRWLTEVDVDHTMRLQPLLRSLFFWLMDTDDLQRHLQAEARYYRDLAEQEGIHFVGRLATYKYYNMDQVVAQALTVYASLCNLNRAEATNLICEPRITTVTFSSSGKVKRSRRRTVLAIP